MSNRDKQREEATASSPMIGNRRPAKKSGVKIATKENVLPEDKKQNVLPEDKNMGEKSVASKPVNFVLPEDKDKKHKASNQNGHLPLSEITPWSFANRPEDEFGADEEWHDFVQSIRLHGVDQPVTVRPNPNGQGFELICGRRRYTASLECGLGSIPAIVRDLDDGEAAALQDRENEQRQDLSAWARSQSWKQLLDAGVFKNNSQLGAAMGLDRRYVNSIMVYTRIPSEILDSIVTKSNISIKLAQSIVNFTKVTDEQPKNIVKKHSDIIVGIADQISEGSITPTKLKATITKIMSKDGDGKTKDSYDDSIGIVNGVRYFTLRKDSNGTPTISILKEAREKMNEIEIAEMLTDLFK